MNPFDGDSGRFLVLVNDEEHSQWRAQDWTDFLPLSLRERMPAGRASEK